ncbi:MAG: thiamine phosphate synthase [Candidatus Omnitrophica bacterium]|nr:thiamine phosphate synthase [Candidatus Omnitrophota bacterium]
MKGYYFITDASLSRAGIYKDVQSALKAKVAVVQYRAKDAGSVRMYEEARRLRALCKGCIFLVNDRVDIALAAGADGVHLGQDDLPYEAARRVLGKNKIIGLTVRSLRDAREAERKGADYVAAAPIFKTRTKDNAGPPRGVAFIRALKKQLHIPVAAIRGIDLSNAPQVVSAGADMLCAISAVVTRPSVALEIRKFQRLF